MGLIKKLLGDSNKKAVDQYQRLILEINSHEDKIEKLTHEKIKKRVVEIRAEVQKVLQGYDIANKDDFARKETDILNKFRVEMFALTREAARRSLKQRHFDVQLIGGLVLDDGKIAEMMTGEGKTLVATLPCSLNAITGKGVHVVTVNDYLAKRDAGWMGQIYDYLGLSVGAIIHDQSFIYDREYTAENILDEKTIHLRPVSRKEAYLADITYGTNNEYGFDYLRDNMVQTAEQIVQRPLHFSIVDEVDSILIDEARTPLIISAPAQESTDKYTQIDLLVKQLDDKNDYTVDEKQHAVSLTDVGIAHMEKLLNVTNIYEEFGIENVHHIEQALKANVLFKKDRDYVVKDGEIIIVDEFTGRLMQGRRYSEGLHQAIEAKEGVEIKRESLTLATISFQNYFRLYVKLAGMTGTAATEAEEFSKIYKLPVLSIPPNRENVREDFADLIYKNERAKYLAVSEKIAQLNEKGQPVLVGTVSIEKNELLSDLLRKRGVKHEVLNAKNHEKEALIISKAGNFSSVTVATNMAGRGTDIVLDEKAKQAGGLFVIGTERHESRRIDNQLRGRSARQGDPGTTQFYVSLEDDLMRIFGSKKVSGIMERLGLPDDQAIQHKMISKSLESAQRKVEGHNFDIRKHLVEYDDVMNKQRAYIYKLRHDILTKDSLKEMVLEILNQEASNLINSHFNHQASELEIDEIEKKIKAITNKDLLLAKNIKINDLEGAVKYLQKYLKDRYEEREEKLGEKNLRLIEKALFLRTIDMLWIDHLDAMDHLRDGIGLRGYGQKDPLVEYKNESYKMFKTLLMAVNSELINLIFRVEIKTPEKKAPESIITKAASQATPMAKEANQREQKSVKRGTKVGRNDPCPCGSGKKYKKCHGK